jgi:phage-related minor tail protein
MAGRPPGVRTLVKAIAKLSPAQLRKLLTTAKAPSSGKLERLERVRDRHLAAAKKLERQIAKLSGKNGTVATPSRSARKPGRKKGYKLSAATRRKMSEAAKRRYAAKGKTEAAPAPGKGKRKPFSAETKAKMAAAQKARWAKVKGKATALVEAQ